jgi:26S proteasome regulatory subunit N5
LNENIVLLMKKRALLKQVIRVFNKAVTSMMQEAMKFVAEITDMKIKLELINTLRTVSDGKVFLLLIIDIC